MIEQQHTGTQVSWWKQRGGLSAGVGLVSASQSPELWGWEVGRGETVYKDRVRVGWGKPTQFQNTAFLGSYFGGAELQVWVSEGGWDWRGWGVGNCISKPHLCGSAESSLQVWSHRHSYRFPSAFRSWAQSDGKKKWPRCVWLHSTHLLCAVNRGRFIHCRLLR